MNEQPLPLLPLVLARIPRALRRALAQEGVPCVEQAIAPAGGRFVLFDSTISTGAHAVPGQTPIDVNVLRGGWRDDPFEALDDERTLRRAWQIGPLAPSETVARVDKRVVRERLLADLRKRLEASGGIWLRVGAFPYPYRSAFNFRIDHDDFVPGDFAATLAATTGHEHAISHYVCASTHARHADSLARLAGSHVGSHGYWHHTYQTADENLQNIGRGINALRAAGVEPVGFAAPHGRFNRGLHAALESLGVSHSSEFGLAYDDLPFFPYEGRVLQIPVHPICLGVFLEAHNEATSQPWTPADAAQLALSHFERMIDEKRRAGEPIFLYGHPEGRLGRFPHLLRATLNAAARHADVWGVNLAEFADWWRARSELTVVVSQQAGGLTARVQHAPPAHRFALELCRGEQILSLPVAEGGVQFCPDSANFKTRLAAPRLYPIASDQPEAFRASLRRYLDWERVTPIEEINVRTWRGWAKRTLRRIKA
ncbi:MAG TPA: hypothetical protein VHC19_21725 [Pirellulales bacterium]|nr:hypothetical protein [Pirellulales bacterium]